MGSYIAITIGPIFDTINSASSPAALWTGSYLFSYLTKTLCGLFVEAGIPKEDILSPFYPATDVIEGSCAGVGLYHDRIVVRAEKTFFEEKIQSIRDEAVRHVADTFGIRKEFLKEYLLVAAAHFEGIENPIIETSKALDCLELAKPICHGDNPLMTLFVSKENYGNENIKKLVIVKDADKDWQLFKDRNTYNIKSISDIAGVERITGMKKHKYYAVVRADGDKMGSLIERLQENDIRRFSERCLKYCADLANEVRKFGGVTIYSGGDDLLALLPCESEKGETVFDFVASANEIFGEHFPEPELSLSMGVTICYYKFPLYEALSDSQYMLFDVAKKTRNCAAFHIQKHAGQSEGLIVPMDALTGFLEALQTYTKNADGEWFSSIHHKLHDFRSMLLAAGSDKAKIYTVFENLFDADVHHNNTALEQKLPELYYRLKTDMPVKTIEKANEHEDIDTLGYMLRVFRFFVEKGDRE